jgi:hypothetical protein
MTEYCPRINGGPRATSAISVIEIEVAVNVAGIRASNVYAAKIPNRPNQHRSWFVRREGSGGHT